ncbi:MAG: DUF3696 domain-containing protein [Blautia sp.]|nr:DUF3696 domain-containing protein [Blautia sp.]MCM1200879.1 DUF3696 domain-containing protein [Bacteroides fragilis]
MIQRLQIKGFKCFEDADFTFGNLTLLAGKNSMGKSTVIQAILAMIQDGNNPFAGPCINIGKISELKNKYVGSQEIELIVNSTFSKKIYDDKSAAESRGTLSEEVTILYLSADRIGVRDTYETNSDNPDKIGVRCEYAYQYLARHASDDWKENILVYDFDDKLTFGGQVDYWLRRILGYTIRAEEIERTDLISVSFTNNRLRDNIRPKNVGTGVSYIAEVIIAALSCRQGDVLIIENPEIHLHPSGQSELLFFLAFLAGKGIQIIMETHSDHIYNGVRKCVSMDCIENTKTAIYFFEETENGGSAPVKIPLDKNGKVLLQKDGLFDQIKKDLDIILGW